MLAAAGVEWKTVSQRDKEAELLAAGSEIRAAIGRYFLKSPTGLRQYPKSLADLVEDKRGLKPEHWLRRLYPDPMTGEHEWELIKAPDGGIMGVASRGLATPLKRANFPDKYEEFTDAECYCDWKFVYKPKIPRRLAVHL
jgi:hypothetical protein